MPKRNLIDIKRTSLVARTKLKKNFFRFSFRLDFSGSEVVTESPNGCHGSFVSERSWVRLRMPTINHLSNVISRCLVSTINSGFSRTRKTLRLSCSWWDLCLKPLGLQHDSMSIQIEEVGYISLLGSISLYQRPASR